MRTKYSRICCAFLFGAFFSCSNDKKAAEVETAGKDNLTAVTTAPSTDSRSDSSLNDVKLVIQEKLPGWAGSFTGFNVDSFKLSQKMNFEWRDSDIPDDINKFYTFYKPSLVYSPDSSMFIDLYSPNIWLERKGKKILATADVDQSIALVNLKTNEWKSILFFGPSSGIEEAVWVTPNQFVLAGMFFNDDGKAIPILLVGDLTTRVFRWFESNSTRAESTNYKASGLVKLKIDEWE
jgi:hypothetical protein